MSSRTSLLINGERFEVEVLERTARAIRFTLAGREYLVELEEAAPQAGAHAPKNMQLAAARTAVPGASGQVVSSLPGVVVDILVKQGETIQAGAVLLRIEAMKMQNSIFAPVSGTVTAIHVEPGMEVGDGQLLVELQDEQ